jgi:hypothetical protein
MSSKIIQNELDCFALKASELCLLLEHTSKFDKNDFVAKLCELLPAVYSALIIVSKEAEPIDEAPQHVVTDAHWQKIKMDVNAKLGSFDDYQEIFEPEAQTIGEEVMQSISDNLADIYQDIKNFTYAYGIGSNEEILAALYECKENFENYWGQKLVNVLRAIHNLCFNNPLFAEDNEELTEKPDNKKENWIISQRIKDFNNEQ